MTLTDWIQAISMVILVVVTSIYVWRTHAISKATKEQADATKEQFLGEARPYLLLRLKDSAVQWNNIEPDKHYPKEFQIIIHNAGKGPAIRLYAAQWHQYKSHFVSENKGYLLSGKEWGTTIGRFTKLIDEKEGWLPELREIIKQDSPRIVAVKYEDIHKHTWVSYLYLEKHPDDNAFVIEGEQNIVELKEK